MGGLCVHGGHAGPFFVASRRRYRPRPRGAHPPVFLWTPIKRVLSSPAWGAQSWATVATSTTVGVDGKPRTCRGSRHRQRAWSKPPLADPSPCTSHVFPFPSGQPMPNKPRPQSPWRGYPNPPVHLCHELGAGPSQPSLWRLRGGIRGPSVGNPGTGRTKAGVWST